MIPLIDLSFAQISILMSLCPIYDLRRSRKNLSGLNLRSSDGTTGAGIYDIVAQNGLQSVFALILGL